MPHTQIGLDSVLLVGWFICLFGVLRPMTYIMSYWDDLFVGVLDPGIHIMPYHDRYQLVFAEVLHPGTHLM